MRLSEQIKSALTADEVVRRYGYSPNRAGFIQCPFHKGDHHASLKVNPGNRGWHCFGCGEGGSVIDFVMKLFGTDVKGAMERLNIDFGLGFTSEPMSKQEISERVKESERLQRELEAFREEYDRKVTEYRQLWLARQAGYEHPLYMKACLLLPNLEQWFEEHHWR